LGGGDDGGFGGADVSETGNRLHKHSRAEEGPVVFGQGTKWWELLTVEREAE